VKLRGRVFSRRVEVALSSTIHAVTVAPNLKLLI